MPLVSVELKLKRVRWVHWCMGISYIQLRMCKFMTTTLRSFLLTFELAKALLNLWLPSPAPLCPVFHTFKKDPGLFRYRPCILSDWYVLSIKVTYSLGGGALKGFSVPGFSIRLGPCQNSRQHFSIISAYILWYTSIWWLVKRLTCINWPHKLWFGV